SPRHRHGARAAGGRHHRPEGGSRAGGGGRLTVRAARNEHKKRTPPYGDAGTILYTLPVLPTGPVCSVVNTYNSPSASSPRPRINSSSSITICHGHIAPGSAGRSAVMMTPAPRLKARLQSANTYRP